MRSSAHRVVASSPREPLCAGQGVPRGAGLRRQGRGLRMRHRRRPPGRAAARRRDRAQAVVQPGTRVAAVDRLSACDAVYLAVVATRRGRDQDRRVHRLCRLLGLGLLAVDLRLGTVQMTGSRTTTHRSRVPPARAGRARYGPRPNCFDANVQIIRDASGPSWSLNGASAAPPLHAWPSRSTRTSVATVWRPRSNAVTVAP